MSEKRDFAAFCVWGWVLGVTAFFIAKSGLSFPPLIASWLAMPPAVVPTAPASAVHLKSVSITALLAIALFGAGHWTARRAGLAFHNRWEAAALAYAGGYGLCGTLIFLLGLAGGWNPAILQTSAVFLACLGLREIGRLPRRRTEPWSKASAWTGAAVLLAWMGLARLALAPETFYDALQYHLALPNLYLLHGGIIPTPENSYSGVPGLPQMLYGWAMAFDEAGVSPAFFHAAQFVAVAALMVGFGVRLGFPGAGILAAAAFLGAPVVMAEMIRTSVGMEEALFQLAAFLSLSAALGARPADKRWLAASGLFLGFSMSSKYTAWLVPLAFLAAALWLKRRARAEKDALSPLSLGGLLRVACFAALVLAPWVLKNVAFYGNPLFPFLQRIFPAGPYAPDVDVIISGGGGAKIAGVLDYAALPVKMLLPPESILHTVGLFFPAMLPLLFWVKLEPAEKLLAVLTLGVWLPLGLFTDHPRFFIPHLAAAAVLLSVILCRARREKAVPGQSILAGLCLGFIGLVWFAWLAGPSNREKLGNYLGWRSYSYHLGNSGNSYPSPPFAAIEYLNHLDLGGGKVLFYGDPRTFYSRQRFLAASDDQAPLLEVWANQARDAEDLKRRVDAEGVKYVLLNRAELMRRRAKIYLSAEGGRTLIDFWRKYTRADFDVREPRNRWVSAHRVLTAEEAARPHEMQNLFTGP